MYISPSLLSFKKWQPNSYILPFLPNDYNMFIYISTIKSLKE